MEDLVNLHTTQIEEHKDEIQYIIRKIRRFEDESLLSSAPNTNDSQIQMKHMEKQKDFFCKIESLEEQIDQNKDKIQHMTRMKDDAFQKIAELKYVVNELKESTENDQRENEKFLRQHKDKINTLTQTVNDHTKSNRNILSKLQEHDLKLHATGSMSMTSPFQIVMDSDKFPLLKSITSHHSHFSSLSKSVTNILLEGDNISAVQQFYNAINTAFMTILSSNTFLPEYVDLTPNFDYESHLIPDPMHTKHTEALNIYKNMSKSLLNHLQSKATIPPRQAPRAALILQENALEQCGFSLFFTIIGKLSPQLGGHARDLEVYVNSLSISDGEPVLDYYIRALKMYKEISLQRDSTGKQNRLIRRFVSLLFQYKPFSECLRPVMTDIRKFFLLPDNHLQRFPINLPTIYQEHLCDKCAPHTISHNSKNSLHDPILNMLTIDDTHNAQERDDDEDINEDLHQPIGNAATYTRNQDYTSQSSSPYNYVAPRCVVCGLTQKECHQKWRELHDPKDPNTCPFRGPEFITDKQIREHVLQYNLKHPQDKSTMNNKSTKNESPPNKKETSGNDNPYPPLPPTLPTPKTNMATTSISDHEECIKNESNAVSINNTTNDTSTTEDAGTINSTTDNKNNMANKDRINNRDENAISSQDSTNTKNDITNNNNESQDTIPYGNTNIGNSRDHDNSFTVERDSVHPPSTLFMNHSTAMDVSPIQSLLNYIESTATTPLYQPKMGMLSTVDKKRSSQNKNQTNKNEKKTPITPTIGQIESIAPAMFYSFQE